MSFDFYPYYLVHRTPQSSQLMCKYVLAFLKNFDTNSLTLETESIVGLGGQLTLNAFGRIKAGLTTLRTAANIEIMLKIPLNVGLSGQDASISFFPPVTGFSALFSEKSLCKS